MKKVFRLSPYPLIMFYNFLHEETHFSVYLLLGILWFIESILSVIALFLFLFFVFYNWSLLVHKTNRVFIYEKEIR